MSEITLGPSRRIILQDLNVALSSNFREIKSFSTLEEFICQHEKYREWLIELLREEFVILCTARSKDFQEITLSRIYSETGWKPNACFFNDLIKSEKNLYSAPAAKREYLLNRIFPKYGSDPSLYFAIESNYKTRDMYDSLGIYSIDANRDDSRPWKSIPQEHF
tara:strand:- start:2589 stop:3080 length:492 start_codon:yes stop_codon:yes gene_type:complete